MCLVGDIHKFYEYKDEGYALELQILCWTTTTTDLLIEHGFLAD